MDAPTLMQRGGLEALPVPQAAALLRHALGPLATGEPAFSDPAEQAVFEEHAIGRYDRYVAALCRIAAERDMPAMLAALLIASAGRGPLLEDVARRAAAWACEAPPVRPMNRIEADRFVEALGSEGFQAAVARWALLQPVPGDDTEHRNLIHEAQEEWRKQGGQSRAKRKRTIENDWPPGPSS